MTCQECDRPLVWAGMGWDEHTEEWHRLLRAHYYRVIWTQVGREVWRRATGE